MGWSTCKGLEYQIGEWGAVPSLVHPAQGAAVWISCSVRVNRIRHANLLMQYSTLVARALIKTYDDGKSGLCETGQECRTDGYREDEGLNFDTMTIASATKLREWQWNAQIA